jgi:hypothetical protein
MQRVPSEFLNGYAATPEFADSQFVTFPGCERGICFRSSKLNGGGQMRLLNGDTLHLDCGRDVVLDECYMKRSALGWIEGDKDYIRTEVIEGLPEKIRRQFPGEYYGVLIKPIPDGDLPVFTFMVSLYCRETVGVDPDKDYSYLVVCWLGNNIDANLWELIQGEIRTVDWDNNAVNGVI